jgi:hypothetical protein
MAIVPKTIGRNFRRKKTRRKRGFAANGQPTVSLFVGFSNVLKKPALFDIPENSRVCGL